MLTDFDIEKREPESMSVSELNQVVRVLREKLYHARLPTSQVSSSEELTPQQKLDNFMAIVSKEPPSPATVSTFSSDELRDQVREELAQQMMDNMFGDGLERDYIWDGVEIVGLNHMDDEELAEEMGMSVEEINQRAAEGRELDPDEP